MQEFLQALLQFPTVVFAGLLVISLFYWALVIVGAAHLNPFHGVHAGAHAGAHGVDAVAGKAHALTEALAFMGLTRVPITISFSVFSLLAWFISIATRQALDATLGDVGAAAVATGAAVVGGLVGAAAVAKPIAGIFTETTRVGPEGLVGRVVKATTEVVDDARGQGEIDDGAGGITVQIRTAPGVMMKRGDEAIVIEHDDGASFYLVEPQRSVVPSEAEQLAAPVEASAPSRR